MIAYLFHHNKGHESFCTQVGFFFIIIIINIFKILFTPTKHKNYTQKKKKKKNLKSLHQFTHSFSENLY
jgi:hypothetical protein